MIVRLWVLLALLTARRFDRLEGPHCNASGRAGWMAKYSGPPFSSGMPISDAKTVARPLRVNFTISPLAEGGICATKSLPALSKISPRGLGRPDANLLLAPCGVNLRIPS